MELLDRIQYLMKLNNLSPSAFADQIDVPRSSMSHLLSGRNKPSLEFIQKIILAFPKVSADWLLYGKTHVSETNTISTEALPGKREKVTTPTLPENRESKKIKKIVVFYEDLTFEEFLHASL